MTGNSLMTLSFKAVFSFSQIVFTFCVDLAYIHSVVVPVDGYMHVHVIFFRSDVCVFS